MKFPSLVAAIAFSTVVPIFAITDADIAPAALMGKTLVFDIVNGGAPYATTGSFSGTFAASGNGFTLANVTGDTVPASTTYTATASGGYTTCQIPDFIAGQSDANLTLYVMTDGQGGYEVSLPGVFGVSLNGTFTIGAPVVKSASDISVKLGKKSELTDGKGKLDFSTVLVGKKRTKNLVITNDGTAPLKMKGFTVTGKKRKEFSVSAPKIGAIAPGASVTIRVTFSPKAIGIRKAKLHILSNDKDEASFDVALDGAGGGIK